MRFFRIVGTLLVLASLAHHFTQRVPDWAYDVSLVSGVVLLNVIDQKRNPTVS